jgi:hypothetical protein
VHDRTDQAFDRQVPLTRHGVDLSDPGRVASCSTERIDLFEQVTSKTSTPERGGDVEVDVNDPSIVGTRA